MQDFTSGIILGIIIMVALFILPFNLILSEHTNVISRSIIINGNFIHKRGGYFIEGKVYKFTPSGNIEILNLKDTK